MLECAGCHTISMSHEAAIGGGDFVEQTYYPSPVSRKQPSWVLLLAIGFGYEGVLGDLLLEIYQALAGGQLRLAAMGVRALLEQVMIAKVGDLRTFDDKLDAFQKAGYISFLQRDAMRATLDMGDAAMHRAYKPTEREINTALDIVETVFSVIFEQKDAAERLRDTVPPRQPRK
jgi:hypothetical protein